jgi:GTP cyclohydrolase IA
MRTFWSKSKRKEMPLCYVERDPTSMDKLKWLLDKGVLDRKGFISLTDIEINSLYTYWQSSQSGQPILAKLDEGMKGEQAMTIPVTTDELAAIESADEMARIRDEMAKMRDDIIQKGQRAKAVHHVSQALSLLGIECHVGHPSRERTPERFVDYLQEFMQPCNIEQILGEGFDATSDGTSIHSMIVQSRIPFKGMCEHHLLPMIGYASVGYIPRDKIIGISKLTRIVHAVGHEKPSLQEAITERIADALFEGLKSSGSIVVIKSAHMCMSARGVSAPEVMTTTSCIRGAFIHVQSAREEFFHLVGVS